MITKTQFYQTQIQGFKQQTLTIRSIYLAVPEEYPSFQPGHLLQVLVEQPKEGIASPVKTYSICSLYDDNVIELCVDLVNAQGVSGLLHHSPPGTPIQITGPKGEFLLSEVSNNPLLLVGLGSGIGVIWGLARHHFHTRPQTGRNVHLYAINSDETSIPFQEDMENAVDYYPTLEVYPVLQTNGYDTDEIVDRILSHAAHPKQWEIYLAGPKMPILEIRDHLVDVGFNREGIHMLGYQ